MDKEKISAHTLCRYSRLLTTAERKILYYDLISMVRILHWETSLPRLNFEMSAIQASNSNQILFSLLYCITTTKAFDDMPPLCASAAVLTLCHFNGALCQFGSYGWHWLYNTLCVIIQNCLMNKHQAVLIVLKIVYFKMPKKTFVLRLI